MTESIIIKEQVLTNFVYAVFKYLYKLDSLKSFVKNFESNSLNDTEIIYKIPEDNGCKLVGLFIKTTQSKIEERNNGHNRWFPNPFLVGDLNLYLTNQWNANGNYSLSLHSLNHFINKYYSLCCVQEGKFFLLKGNETKINEINNNQEIIKIDIHEDITSDIISSIKHTKLIYEDKLIQRYAYSLLTKPFVILSGLAGSGKTQLALAFAKALVEDEKKQMCVVSVGSDWTNREPLLGYPNALKENSYVKPENGVLNLLIECNKSENASKPYFLILDEMNLSYVERYFADFLSAMESHMKIPLWKGNDDDVPHSVALPKNLFLVGTINVDETTYMFSPKVLDRASVIEFKVSAQEMQSFLDTAPVVDINKINGTAKNMAAEFVRMASESIEISKDANAILMDFFKHLKSVNAEFGYRTATEIGRFISLSKGVLGDDVAVDAAIVQKLLPKLHGSRKKVVPVLKKLWEQCGCKDELEGIKDSEEAEEVVKTAKYKMAADKILRMYNCAVDNGFTSFAEA